MIFFIRYRVLPKVTLLFDWTVLESYEELDAVLWRAFQTPLPGSEIVRNLSENDFCSRTSERAEKRGLKKVGFRVFFLTGMRTGMYWGQG